MVIYWEDVVLFFILFNFGLNCAILYNILLWKEEWKRRGSK